MRKPKLFCVSQEWYIEPFEYLVTVVCKPADADIIMFTGGSDVSPKLYGDVPGKFTSSDRCRDEREVAVFKTALAAGKRFLGICRGAQFLTVMAGGKLVQHVTNHGEPHQIVGHDRAGAGFGMFKMAVSSTHHQMMNPDDTEHMLLAWAEGRSKVYLNGWNEDILHCRMEPEIVWYPKIQGLAIQCHPEIMDFNSPGVQYCRSLFKEYLSNV